MIVLDIERKRFRCDKRRKRSITGTRTRSIAVEPKLQNVDTRYLVPMTIMAAAVDLPA